MSLSVEAVGIAKKYTDDSIKGIVGALAGKIVQLNQQQKIMVLLP